jgi:hypothetical protein
MFFPMTPEMINKIIESNKKKAPLSFEAYYNKRFKEECKYVADTPTFRMNYIEVTTHLLQAIREIALKEYKENWPLAPIINNELVTELDNKSVISDYDILDECDLESVESDQISNSVQDQEEPQPTRRSTRLKNKFI